VVGTTGRVRGGEKEQFDPPKRRMNNNKTFPGESSTLERGIPGVAGT